MPAPHRLPKPDRRSGIWRIQLVRGFQQRFVLTSLGWLSMCLLALCALVFLPLMARLAQAPAEAGEAATTFLYLHARLWPAVVAVLALTALHLIVTTHRVAGPLVRIRATLAGIRDLDWSQVVRLRKGDYLDDEAAALNDVLDGLRAYHAETRRLGEEVARLAAEAGDRAAAAGDAGLASDLSRVSTEADRLLRHLQRARVTAAAPAVVTRDEAAPATPRGSAGFTLVEVLLALALITVIAAMAIPGYTRALEAARVARATGDIKAIEKDLLVKRLLDGSFPATLADIGRDTLRDPWGNAYQYLPLPDGKNPKGARKDRNLHPLNSDFDLYSMGADGKTQAPITAKTSQDDVIRASDGGFVGLASLF